MGTFIVGIVLLFIVLLVIMIIIKNSKNGKILKCGGDCEKCSGYCGTKNKN